MSDEITKAGFTHPCKETCSGYKQAAAEERERLSKLAPEFLGDKCDLCAGPVTIVGHTTMHYESAAATIGALREENDKLRKDIMDLCKEASTLCQAAMQLAAK